ncbi:alanine racemase [Lichenicoccus sp.]|uniref:alanine racemase n=1 Tax=Lichenicoccus sp. TaxID=2781899 RepID=UPI003D14C241
MKAGIEAASAGGLLTIDLDAIAANWRTLRDMASPALCAAVIKANGYGLGADLVARALHDAGCRDFFVAHLHEGASLPPEVTRDSRIFILNGPPPGTCEAMAARGLIPVLNSLDQIAEWRAMAAPAALQVDTGMSRFGLSPAEFRALLADPNGLAGLAPVLLMSHLACADTPEHPLNVSQLACFESCRALLPDLPASLAASFGIMLGRPFHYQMIRPGAALYGVNPTPGCSNPMRPAIRLQGRIVQTRWIAPGDSVGYGARFTATAPTRIATVAVGYADGFLRAGSGRGIATLPSGEALPMVGRISMDCLALDATGLGEAALPAGTAIDLIGPHISLDAAAASAGTIGYELLTALGSRYARHYVGGQAGHSA